MIVKHYAPNMKEDGAAFQFKMGIKDRDYMGCMFIECTPQEGPKPPPGSKISPFNWAKSKMAVMINQDECGTLAAFIDGLNTDQKIEFYHKHPDTGDTIIRFSKPFPDGEQRYSNTWNIGIKRGDRVVKSFMTTGTMYQIKLLAEQVIINAPN